MKKKSLKKFNLSKHTVANMNNEPMLTAKGGLGRNTDDVCWPDDSEDVICVGYQTKGCYTNYTCELPVGCPRTAIGGTC
ncbi:MAG: hypothetical protein GY765_37665 [bacterium]|nr:hypothetical protein [bacterium]